MEYDFPSLDAMPGKPFVAADNPGGIEAAIAKAFGPGSEPMLAAPVDTSVKLPFGLLRDGEALQEAEVRELTGADEEALARVAGHPLRYLDTLLLRGTVQIGGLPCEQKLLRELTVADRHTLLVAIRRATYGNELRFNGLVCPHCGQSIDLLIVHLDDLDDPQPFDPLVRTFEVRLRRGTATVRQPTGDDEQAVADPERNLAERNTLLIARCVVSAEIGDGQTRGSEAMARALGVVDRRAILRAIDEHTYGPHFGDVSFTHEVCGREVPLPLTAGDLFRD